MKFVIVGCGSAKKDSGLWPAKDLYTSTYFDKKRQYAESVGDRWVILSAEHGLVPPTAELRPYETSIDDLGGGELDDLAHHVGLELIDWTAAQGDGGNDDEIVVLAGKRYIEPLRQRDVFTAGVRPTVSFPLQQNDLSGIGEQMAWLKSRAEGHEQTKIVTDGGRDEYDSTVAQFGRGALVQERGSGRYHHITARFRNIEDGRVLYKVLDPTHTHDWWYYEEDLVEDFRPAGISLNCGVKPASVFGSIVDGILRGYNEIQTA